MKYLVTGAAGFAGAALVKRLTELENETHIILKPETDAWRLKDIFDKFIVHRVDLAASTEIKDLVKKIKPEVVYHLAAHGVYPFQTDVEEILKNNFLATKNLLDACLGIDLRMFVNTGTFLEYGFKEKPMCEDEIIAPDGGYAASKAAQTHLCQYYAKQKGIPAVILRLFSIYGKYEGRTRLIPNLISKCLRDENLPLVSSKTARDFIYIEDAVDLYLKIINFPEYSGQIFNCATGKQTVLEELVREVIDLTFSKSLPLWNQFPERLWDTPACSGCICKAKKLLGWEPKHSLRDGLQKTIEFFKNEYGG